MRSFFTSLKNFKVSLLKIQTQNVQVIKQKYTIYFSADDLSSTRNRLWYMGQGEEK